LRPTLTRLTPTCAGRATKAEHKDTTEFHQHAADSCACGKFGAAELKHGKPGVVVPMEVNHFAINGISIIAPVESQSPDLRVSNIRRGTH